MPVAKPRPASVLLDLLRSSSHQQLSVQALLRYGAVFGFPGNTIRVTLSRLGARGLVESPRRGWYRLSERSDPVHGFVERWRLGEARVSDWQGGWLLVSAEAPSRRCCWSLETLGLRPLTGSGLWCRPANLELAPEMVRQTAVELGLATACNWWQAEVLLPGAPDVRELWDVPALEKGYHEGAAALQRSMAQLPELRLEAALRESFTLGGEMIHRLAKDPLLPAAHVDVGARRALWKQMLEYDRVGREIWARVGADAPEQTPRPQLLPVA